jgi:protein required for attachment to host cells
MKRQVTWVLVADGGKAFALSNADEAHHYRPVPTFHFEGPHLRDRDIGTDRPSRVFASAFSPQRAATAEIGAMARCEERRFVARVTDALAEVHAKGAFQRLVVVAPPHALGDIRAAMPSALADAVVREVAADLVNLPVDDIVDHLMERAVA